MAKSAAERAREKAQKMKALQEEKAETLASNVTKKEEKTESKPKAKKENNSEIEIVRDGLLIPKDELEAIVALRGRAFSLGIEANKTEVYRAGLQALASLSDAQFKKTFSGLQKVKTGRKPKK